MRLVSAEVIRAVRQALIDQADQIVCDDIGNCPDHAEIHRRTTPSLSVPTFPATARRPRKPQPLAVTASAP